MWKRVVAVFLAVVIVLPHVGNMRVYANQWGTYGAGPMNDSEQCGLRFSLVNAQGDVESVLDVLENPGIRDNMDVPYSVIRLYNQCKVDIARSGNIIENSVYGTPARNTFHNYNSSLGKTYKWKWGYKNDIFLHVPSDYYISTLLVNFVTSSKAELVGNIYNNLKLRSDVWIHGENDSNADNDELKPGMILICDVLDALGVDVYGSGNMDPRSVYLNLIQNFVLKEYVIIIEPIYFISYKLFDPVYDTDTGKWVSCRDLSYKVLYYGSVTELALIGCNRSMNWKDIQGEYHFEVGDECFLMSNVNNNYMWMSLFFNNLSLKAAYVDDEYEYYLSKYNIVPVKATEWDYINYTGVYPEGVTEYNKRGNTNNYFTRLSKGVEMPIYNNVDFITNHACGMTMIVASDFIKPKVETFDYTYNISTDVITSVKISNRSNDSYCTVIKDEEINSFTVTNEQGVPRAIIGHFTIEKIKTELGEIPVHTADGGFANLEVIAPELGITQYEYYSSLDGLLGKNETNGGAPYPVSFMSFNWKTPDKPCTVTFNVEFLNANLVPEPVLGTDAKNSNFNVLKGVEQVYNPDRAVNGTKILSKGGNFFTTFVCEIGDGFQKNIAEKEAPDTVAITSVSPSASLNFAEQQLYNKNMEIRDNYNTYAGHTDSEYYKLDIDDKSPVTSLEWTEYKASYNGNDIVLTPIVQRAEILMRNDENEVLTERKGKIIRTDYSDLYPAYSAEIGSGYGYGIDLYSYYSDDARGAGMNYLRDLAINGNVYPVSLVTNYSHGAVLFPEFLYKDYYGVIEPLEISESGSSPLLARYCLAKNKNSVYYDDESNSDKSRVHFTPTWFPDGEYKISVTMFDAWTPAGQLWFYEDYAINIHGSLYDTWYVSRGQNNQIRG